MDHGERLAEARELVRAADERYKRAKNALEDARYDDTIGGWAKLGPAKLEYDRAWTAREIYRAQLAELEAAATGADPLKAFLTRAVADCVGGR